jgi:hypothetical protein
MKSEGTLDLLSSGLLVGGVLALGAGSVLGIAILSHAGMGLLGGGILSLGLQAILTGSVQFRSRRRRRTASYSGVMARGFGVIFVLVGLGFIGFSILLLAGLDRLFTFSLDQFVRGDFGGGIFIVALGIGCCVWSLGNIVGSNEERSSTGALLFSLPGRIFGVLWFLIGIGVILFGAARIFAPQMLAAWYETLLAAAGAVTSP